MNTATITNDLGSEPVAKRGPRRWPIWLPTALLALCLAAVIAHLLWKGAGANEWELVHEEGDTKVWTIKSPGSPLIRARGVTTIEANTLGGIMKFMRDPDSCDEVGCYDSLIIDDSEFPGLVHYAFKYAMFWPFKPRQWVVKSEFAQDPVTKEINMNYVQTPDKIPYDDCCVRSRYMHNTWRFTPLEDEPGKVEVEFGYDVDPGGMFPYFVVNLAVLDLFTTTFDDLQNALRKDGFRNLTVDYVDEVNEPSAQAGNVAGELANTRGDE